MYFVFIISAADDAIFYPISIENGVVTVNRSADLPETTMNKYNYLLYILTATFIDTSFNDYMAEAKATIVVELHL